LIKFWTGSSELYNLATDPGEKKNLAPDMPEKVRELDALLMKRLGADQAKLPRRNPDYVPKESTQTPSQ
jgi:hypothetical protein